MKTVRELINNARAKGNDVIIENDEASWNEMIGGGWTVLGEWGWVCGEHDFDNCAVANVVELEEGITIITVEG